MNIGDRVCFRTFLGEEFPEGTVNPKEDLWQLLGWQGIVVSTEEKSGMERLPRGERRSGSA